jgi:hypothetical protein
MKEYKQSNSVYKMSFTTQLLKECVMLDVVRVINKYLVPKNVTFEQLCTLGLVEQLLEYCNCTFNIPYNYINGLEYAFKNRNLGIIELIIKKEKDNWNYGLIYACESGYLEIAKLMIKKGADSFNWGLEYACCCENLELVNLMIKNGAIYCSYCKNVNHLFII